MDPVGPWSAYAPYNRLAGVQSTTTASELHHLPSTSPAGAPSTTTAQLLSGSFLTPPPVGYETVFSPLFHPPGTKPAAHYVTQVTQHRQALAQAGSTKQPSDGEYHQSQSFFEQGTGAWQQNSPFGILPHEVVPTTAKATYENFNAHFAAAQSLNHLNPQLVAATVNKNTSRSQSPQVTTTSAKPSQTSSNFYQTPTTFQSETNGNKSYSPSNIQQSCIVTTPSNTASKEYRVLQSTSRTGFADKPFVPPPTKQNASQSPQIQTKPQTKIYSDLGNQQERQQQSRGTDETQSQSSPISFSMMDGPGRLSYAGSNSSAKRSNQPFQHSNYRHYQQGANAEQPDFQRPKSGSDYNSPNGPDCNVVVPRRPSPLQAHSQASPLGHAPSPAYPMYNSPMNSISSPQQNTSNQVTPPSPLDVSVPRPNSQTGAVAYPSVITRALTTEKTFSNDRFDRPNHQQQPQPNQNCWDERQSQQPQQRKFPNQNNNYTLGNSMEIRPIETQNRTPERQQSYFEGHQVPLQDLSSCRGDPMSIVKNLQQQQSCQIAPQEIKQEVKPLPSKRRKSNEKTAATTEGQSSVEYFSGRIPPPAHSSGSNQQNQNGGYFEFDRWNLPATKIFPPQGIHQQHQGLMVPHPHPHHPAPPLPYFPPFLAPHPPEFNSTVDIQPVNSPYKDQSSQQPQFNEQIQQNDQPKVVVPNIEEELNYLSGVPATTKPSGPKPAPIVPNKADKPLGPGAGFMNSYLKFLQGERDSSPPPASRGSNRNKSWSRQQNIKTIQTTENKSDSNGITPVTQSPAAPIKRLTQGDPQDDPRYFPLPKERKRNSFDSSDDGLSSDEDLFSKKLVAQSQNSERKDKKPGTGRKGRPCKPGGPTERKRARLAALAATQKHKDEAGNLQRRESAKRAAKEKINMKQLVANAVDEELELQDFVDSDSDPAWTPQAKEEDDDVLLTNKKNKLKNKQNTRRKSRNLINAAAHEAGINDTDVIPSDPVRKRPGRPCKVPEDDTTLSAPQNNIDDGPFKVGEFVMIKSDLCQAWPSIWKVDGKNLLQKFEPFEQNGRTLYKNTQTYTSWTNESKKQYIAVPINYVMQGPLEVIVEFFRSELGFINKEFIDCVMKQHERYQDNFEVYIQTLISQALDSNFLTEIFQEQDDYFLSNVKTIDDITLTKKSKLLSLLPWPHTVQAAVSTWPCFNVIRDLSVADLQGRTCAACKNPNVGVRVLLYGQPYNPTTLEGCQPDPQSVIEKDFLMCRICASRVELFNKITHQKYLMYVECAKRVAEKRQSDPHKDTTCILNELLADESWLSQLFCDVRSIWAEVDSLHHTNQLKQQPTV